MKKFSFGRLIFYLYCGLVFLFLITPLFIVIPLAFSNVSYLSFPPPSFSFRWWEVFFDSPVWLRVLMMSLRVGVIAAAISLVLGTLAALAISKSKIRFSELLSSIMIMPMVAPLIVIGVGSYLAFARFGMIGNPIGLAIIHAVLGIPYVFINVSASLQSFNDNLEKAALILGANPIKTFLKVKLPIIAPGLIAGALFAFIISFDEIVVALFIGGTGARTLPIQLWDGIRTELTPIIAVASTFLITAYLMLFIVYEITAKFILRRRARLEKAYQARKEERV